MLRYEAVIHRIYYVSVLVVSERRYRIFSSGWFSYLGRSAQSRYQTSHVHDDYKSMDGPWMLILIAQ